MKNKDIKVVFVNASLTTGGSERVMTLVANYCGTAGRSIWTLFQKKQQRSGKTAHRIIWNF